MGQTITGALANIPFPFGIDSDGNYGYKKAGADAVTPFKSGGSLSNVSGSIEWRAIYRGNPAKVPIPCEGWSTIKFYVTYSQYATNISNYLDKVDGTTTSSVTRTYNTWYTIDNSNREYKMLYVVVAGTVSQYAGSGNVQFQLEN